MSFVIIFNFGEETGIGLLEGLSEGNEGLNIWLDSILKIMQSDR